MPPRRSSRTKAVELDDGGSSKTSTKKSKGASKSKGKAKSEPAGDAPIPLLQWPLEILGRALRIDLDSQLGAAAMKRRQTELRKVCKTFDAAVQQATADEGFIESDDTLDLVYCAVTPDEDDGESVGPPSDIERRCGALRRLHIEVDDFTVNDGKITSDDMIAFIVKACSQLVVLSYRRTGVCPQPWLPPWLYHHYRERVQPRNLDDSLVAAICARKSIGSIELPSFIPEASTINRFITALPSLSLLFSNDLRMEKTYWREGGPGWIVDIWETDGLFSGQEKPIYVILGSDLSVLRLHSNFRMNLDRLSASCPRLISLDVFQFTADTSSTLPDLEELRTTLDLPTELSYWERRTGSRRARNAEGQAELHALLKSNARRLALSATVTSAWAGLRLSDFQRILNECCDKTNAPRTLELVMPGSYSLDNDTDRAAVWSTRARDDAIELAAALNLELSFDDKIS